MPLIIVLNCRVWDAALPLTVSESAFLHAVAAQNKIREIRKKLVIVVEERLNTTGTYMKGNGFKLKKVLNLVY